MTAGRLELTWSDKDMRLLAHDDVSYEWVDPTDWRVGEVRLLHDVDTVGDPSDGNLLIRGDAMHALEALIKTPEYAERFVGKVKLVYIDPPFNTGQTFTHYDDNLEHSVWLTMLRDRLEQIQQLLAPDGTVWVHLDDTEQHRARCVLDEIFGAENFVATIVWEKDKGRRNDTDISSAHDYLHVFAPVAKTWKATRNLLPREGQDARYRNPDDDPRGPWLQGDNGTAKSGTEKNRFPVTLPSGRVVVPKGRYWRFSPESLRQAQEEGRVWFGRNGDSLPVIKRYLTDVQDGLVPRTWWPADETGHNQEAKRDHLNKMFPDVDPFDTPKPERLLERVVHIGSDPGDVVLDCFGGSGATAAVAQKMGRRWVTVEQSAATISTFLRPRLEMVVKGEDPGGITESVGWEGGGGFTHVEVGPSMFETVDGSVVMAEWAVGGELAEAVAAQLGFEFVPDGPLAGRKGRKRLAVVDGMVTEAVAEHLVGLIGEKETLLVVARSLEPGVEDLVRELRSGSRARKIPRDLARVGRLPSRLVRLNKKGGGVGG